MLAATIGAPFLGTVVAAIMYGVTTIQTLAFFRLYKQDPCWLKGTVASLWVLDTIHITFIVHAIWTYVVVELGDTLQETQPWSMTAHVLVSNLSDLIVRSVFLYRIWNVSTHGHRWIVTAIAVVSLAAFVSACTFTGWGIRNMKYILYNRALSILLYTNLSSGMVSDVLISAFFCWFLSKRRTGLARTDSIIDYLMLYSLTIGFIMSLAALACIIVYAALPFPNRVAFVAIYFVLPKLLLNALLATLNIRKPIASLVPNGLSVFSMLPERNTPCAGRTVEALGRADRRTVAIIASSIQRQVNVNIHVDVERHILTDEIGGQSSTVQSQKESEQDMCSGSCPDMVSKVCDQMDSS